MNDTARRTLCDLIVEHGHSLYDDPRRCEGLLKDFCGEHRREIFVLVSAIKERVPADLLSKAGVPVPALIPRLTQRLCKNLAITGDAAEWAVETWALALGVVLRDDRAKLATAPAVSTAADDPDENALARLRIAIYATKPGALTAQRKAELHELQRQLNVTMDAARRIFKEVQLQKMVEEGDKSGVQRLLSEDARLANAGDTRYVSVFHRAMETNWEITKLLVMSGANVNTLYEFGYTLLHRFAAQGRVVELKFLVANGADVNLKLENGRTPLSSALVKGQAEAARILIASGSDISIEHATPLHWAVFWGNMDAARSLIARGVDVNARDLCGATPLHWAARFDQGEISSFLTENGADRNIKDKSDPAVTPGEITEFNLRKAIVEATKSGALTPKAATDLRDLRCRLNVPDEAASRIFTEVQLQKSIEANDIAGVRRLLSEDPRLANTRSERYGNVLHQAFYTHPEITEFLLESGANINSLDRDGPDGLSLLYLVAAGGDDLDRLTFLIEHGADVNLKMPNGETPLLVAVDRGHVDTARILIESGADLNVMEAMPLHWAVFCGNREEAQCLIASGADVDAKDKFGATPLHWAARFKQIDVCKVLLCHGADLNARNNSDWSHTVGSGDTPLGEILDQLLDEEDEPHDQHIEIARLLLASGVSIHAEDMFTAVSCGDVDVINLLVSCGADVCASYADGTTPLHSVVSRGRWHIAQSLLNGGANVNAEDDKCWTPLHYLAYPCRSDDTPPNDWDVKVWDLLNTAQVLIAGGANVNASDARGHTPLAYIKSERVKELLRQHGAR